MTHIEFKLLYNQCWFYEAWTYTKRNPSSCSLRQALGIFYHWHSFLWKDSQEMGSGQALCLLVQPHRGSLLGDGGLWCTFISGPHFPTSAPPRVPSGTGQQAVPRRRRTMPMEASLFSLCPPSKCGWKGHGHAQMHRAGEQMEQVYQAMGDYYNDLGVAIIPNTPLLMHDACHFPCALEPVHLTQNIEICKGSEKNWLSLFRSLFRCLYSLYPHLALLITALAFFNGTDRCNKLNLSCHVCSDKFTHPQNPPIWKHLTRVLEVLSTSLLVHLCLYFGCFVTFFIFLKVQCLVRWLLSYFKANSSSHFLRPTCVSWLKLSLLYAGCLIDLYMICTYFRDHAKTIL